MKTEKEKKIQQKYIELQIMDQQLRQLQQQINKIDEQLMELAITDQSIDELRTTKKNSETLVPIAPGIYAEGTIKDVESFVINVGANVAVKKSLEETKKLILQQIEEVSAYREDLANKMQNIANAAMKIEEEIEKETSRKDV